MIDQSGFVCAINGGRDGYQVPLALHEAGLLERFVTDFYAPDVSPGWLPGRLAKRRATGLPKALTAQSHSSFLVQRAADFLGIPMNRVCPWTDRLLAGTALREANRRGSHLYGYAGYLPPRSAIPPGKRVIDFEFHPHPALTYEILREDAARFPEVAWSFAQEQLQFNQNLSSTSWHSADAIVCASAITARSIEHAGCDPARITVVPYGFEPSARFEPRVQDGPMHFLFVGQGVQRKGLHHLLRAWRGVDPDQARLTVVCYFCDPGIAELAQQPGVELLGRQDRPKLDALMQSSDVFVMPSIVEGFGLVYLEALAAGNHVIGTANTGLPDLQLSDAAISLVPVGDIAVLATTIAQLIERRRAGLLDPAAIIAETRSWSWADFRRKIGEHARSVLT